MKIYIKTIILSGVLLVLIALMTLAMIYDVDLFLFKNLSISSMKQKKVDLDALMLAQAKEQTNNKNAKNNLKSAKDSFDVAKQKYENISQETIELVQEATKEEKYFIEYLWIVLGNYATANNLGISIITPGSTADIDKNNSTNNSPIVDSVVGTGSSNKDGIQIIVEGRYANVADFVFDVENDKSLRFRLDNIKMAYEEDNRIQATFDILSLAVLK